MKANQKPHEQEPRQPPLESPRQDNPEPKTCDREHDQSQKSANAGKKKSKLSEVFKVPSTPTSAPTLTPTTSPSPAPNLTHQMNESTGNGDLLSHNSSSMASSANYSKGKGVGKNSGMVAVKGSSTERKIWESQQNINELQDFLTNNPVIIIYLEHFVAILLKITCIFHLNNRTCPFLNSRSILIRYPS